MNETSPWDQHWKHFEEALQLNPAQEFRRRLIASLISKNRVPDTALFMDMGCGNGELIGLLQPLYKKGTFIGVDGSQRALQTAREKNPHAQFYVVDLSSPDWAKKLPEVNPDVVICSEVLEHLDQPERLLEEMSTFIQPNGILILTVPGGPRSRFDLFIGHRRHYSTHALFDLCKTAGYDILEINGAGFPIFNLYRCVVIARGGQLIQDVELGQKKNISTFAKLGMTLFRVLFKLPLLNHQWGWQRYAVLKRSAPHSK